MYQSLLTGKHILRRNSYRQQIRRYQRHLEVKKQVE